MKISHPNPDHSRTFNIYFLIIALLNLIVYFPSLFHSARSDHLWFLAGIADKEDWLSIMQKCFTFVQTSEFNPGDQVFFRPILFCFAGTLKFLFGYNFVAWQMTGLILHLTTLWLLLKLLYRIRPTIWALLLTAFFSVQVTNIEMVTWQQTFGYMIAIIMLLVGMNQLWLYFVKGQSEFWRILLIVFAMLMACFSYEVMNIFALFFVIYAGVYSPQKKRVVNSFLMMLPCVIYSLSLKAILPGNVPSIHTNFASLTDTFKNLLLINTNWFWIGIFGYSFNDFHVRERTCYFPINYLASVPNIITTILTGLFFLTFFRRFKLSKSDPGLGFIYLTLLMLLTFISIYCVFRINPKGIDYLGNSLYYFYIYWLLLLIVLYSAWDRHSEGRGPRTFLNPRLLKIFFVFVILLNACFSFMLLHKQAWIFRPRINFINYIESLRKKHKDEKDFSFYAGSDVFGNDVILWLHKQRDPEGKIYTIAELLFPNYYRAENPKYLIQAGFFAEDSPGPKN